MAFLARVVNQLVRRPDADSQPSQNGAGSVLGHGLRTLARAAFSPLTAAPATAVRLSELLGNLGARGRAIPPQRRQAPDPRLALRALGGLLRPEPEVQASYLAILTATMDRAVAREVHPAFLDILGQLHADELRLLAGFDGSRPEPVLSVVSRLRHGGGSRTELRHFSLLGERTGCERPERAATYLDNMFRLGLLEMRSARITDDLRPFEELERHPTVKALRARIEAQRPLTGTTTHMGAAPDEIVADLQLKLVGLTSFGRQFRGACVYRAELHPTGMA